MSLTLKVPTHLDGRNPLVGRFTARELVPVVAGLFGAAGVMSQPHLALALRVFYALALLVLGTAAGLLRPGGRSLMAWGRLAMMHVCGARSAAWGPPDPPAPASHARDALRPPHLFGISGTAAVATAATRRDDVLPRQPARFPATQRAPFVPVEIVDETVLFADGRRCAVLACTGMGSGAMDSDQQRALHVAYQAFLLGLTFPLQMLICADPVNLGPYAARRSARLAGRSLAVRRLGSADTAYMRRAVARMGGLDQQVYVVIPAPAPASGRPKGAGLLRAWHNQRHGTGTLDASGPDAPARVLAERCAAVREGLERCGVHGWRLDTPALRALFYRRLCPRTARLQPLDAGHTRPPASASAVFDHGAVPRTLYDEEARTLYDEEEGNV